MPPVSQAIAKRKSRKMLQNEDLNFNNLADVNKPRKPLGGFGNTATQGFYSTKSSFYNHSKNNNNKSLLNHNKFADTKTTVGGAEVARMSATQEQFMDVKEQNSASKSKVPKTNGGLQDDKSSLTMAMASTSVAEVTSRLYNKKVISKMRQKSQ